MRNSPALKEAQATCDGLHRLIRRISAAAVDMDKSGSDSYEMHALISSAHTCVINLRSQLALCETSTEDEPSNVHPIKRESPAVDDSYQATHNNLKIAK